MVKANSDNVVYHLGCNTVATIRAIGGAAWTIRMIHNPDNHMEQAFRVGGYSGERVFSSLRGALQHVRHQADGQDIYLTLQ